MAKSKAARLAAADDLMNALPAFRRGAVEFPSGVAENDNRLGAIADRLGRVAALRAELESYEKKLKEVIIEAGVDAVEGKLFRATLSIFEQERLDTTALRAALDEKILAKYLVSSKTTQVRVKARTGALADAA